MSLRDAWQVILKHAALAVWTLVLLALSVEILAPGSVSAFFSLLWFVPIAFVLALLVPRQETRAWTSLVWSLPLAALLGLYTAVRTSGLGRSSLFLGLLVGVSVAVAGLVLARKSTDSE
jgi:hypothetical protein